MQVHVPTSPALQVCEVHVLTFFLLQVCEVHVLTFFCVTGMSLASFNLSKECDITEVGSMLFTRFVSGTRSVLVFL